MLARAAAIDDATGDLIAEASAKTQRRDAADPGRRRAPDDQAAPPRPPRRQRLAAQANDCHPPNHSREQHAKTGITQDPASFHAKQAPVTPAAPRDPDHMPVAIPDPDPPSHNHQARD